MSRACAPHSEDASAHAVQGGPVFEHRIFLLWHVVHLRRVSHERGVFDGVGMIYAVMRFVGMVYRHGRSFEFTGEENGGWDASRRELSIWPASVGQSCRESELHLTFLPSSITTCLLFILSPQSLSYRALIHFQTGLCRAVAEFVAMAWRVK